MRDGREYVSIVGSMVSPTHDVAGELKQAVQDIAALRGRPCIMYVGNVVNGNNDSAVVSKDDLPFTEMVASIPAEERRVDIFLATNGGDGAQIARFVNNLRPRFDEVDFLIPSRCMSAGTLFALSGDHIWMNPQACLGPIDPQVPNSSGRFVPAQALLLLVEKLQQDGQAAMAAGHGVPWTAVRIIDTIDKKDLGAAISATGYSETLAQQFLMSYKFRNWTIRQSSQQAVTPEYRQERAARVARELASHARWQDHGHAVSREVLWSEIKLLIDHPDAALERAIRRAWAVCYWLFDKTTVQKIMIGAEYAYIAWSNPEGGNA